MQGQPHAMEHAPGRLSRRSCLSQPARLRTPAISRGAPEGPKSLPAASVLCPGAPNMHLLQPLFWGRPGPLPGAPAQLPTHPADLVREGPACEADKPTACAACMCR